MMRSIVLAFSLLSALPYVAAHGYLHSISIDGQRFEGNAPNRNNVQSPIRTISTTNPVKGANNRAVNCGPSAEPAALVAEARPGSTLTFDWGDVSFFSLPNFISAPLGTHLFYFLRVVAA